MSSSSIPIPIAMHSSSTVSASVTVTQMRITQTANFKPLSHRLGRGLPLIQLHRRLNYGASFRCSAASSGGGDGDAIVLHVGGMMCEGCADNVKKLLQSRPQVSSASVNLASEIAIVYPASEEKTAPDWQKQLGEALAEHLTNCGFSSSLQG
ncbi:copper-transporting ATPase PAA1, chloroplastic-like isoform X2 [Lotus japonicus]|nr:copper-transporting ATPase PAA1, chloroplastic-like isoform X2 [Lotus japonicus]